VTGWLFSRRARNRNHGPFSQKRSQRLSSDSAVEDEDGELLRIEDLLPSPDAGPEALYVRNVLLDELELALDELPEEQRESIRRSRTGRPQLQGAVGGKAAWNVNTLLARKRYAVLRLRERLQNIHEEFLRK